MSVGSVKRFNRPGRTSEQEERQHYNIYNQSQTFNNKGLQIITNSKE